MSGIDVMGIFGFVIRGDVEDASEPLELVEAGDLVVMMNVESNPSIQLCHRISFERRPTFLPRLDYQPAL